MSEAAGDDVENQRAFKAWGSKLSRSSVTLAPEVSAEVLAEEFGELDEDRRDQMCSKAVMIAFDDGHNEVHLKHFQEAYEETELEADDEDTGEDVQEDTSEPNPEPHTEPTGEGGPEIFDEDNDDVPRETESESQDETVPSESDETGEPTPANMERGELEAEVADLRERVEEMEATVQESNALVEAVRRQMKQHSKLLVGHESIQDAVDPEDVENHHQRIVDIDERVQEQGDQIQMVRVDGGGSPDDPDSRAQRIRQTLYNKAKQHSEGQAEMDRDDVDSRLGGGLHRDTVLGAMKRAADGMDAEREERTYTPINGSCNLQPVDSISFVVGEGRGNASKVVMNLSDATGAEIRQNLTTKDTGEAP